MRVSLGDSLGQRKFKFYAIGPRPVEPEEPFTVCAQSILPPCVSNQALIIVLAPSSTVELLAHVPHVLYEVQNNLEPPQSKVSFRKTTDGLTSHFLFSSAPRPSPIKPQNPPPELPLLPIPIPIPLLVFCVCYFEILLRVRGADTQARAPLGYLSTFLVLSERHRACVIRTGPDPLILDLNLFWFPFYRIKDGSLEGVWVLFLSYI